MRLRLLAWHKVADFLGGCTASAETWYETSCIPKPALASVSTISMGSET